MRRGVEARRGSATASRVSRAARARRPPRRARCATSPGAAPRNTARWPGGPGCEPRFVSRRTTQARALRHLALSSAGKRRAMAWRSWLLVVRRANSPQARRGHDPAGGRRERLRAWRAAALQSSIIEDRALSLQRRVAATVNEGASAEPWPPSSTSRGAIRRCATSRRRWAAFCRGRGTEGSRALSLP